MHQNIAIIVYGSTQADARDQAQAVLGFLTDGAHAPFDDGIVLDVMGAESEQGREAVGDAMASTMEAFALCADKIRSILASGATNEELFAWHPRVGGEDFRYWCRKAGDHRGEDVFLYDQDGEGVTTPQHLEDALSKWQVLWQENPEMEAKFKDLSVWVASVDVTL